MLVLADHVTIFNMLITLFSSLNSLKLIIVNISHKILKALSNPTYFYLKEGQENIENLKLRHSLSSLGLGNGHSNERLE